MQSGFWSSDDGQDFTEYSLLLAFVVLLSAAIAQFSPELITACVARVNAQLARAVRMAGG